MPIEINDEDGQELLADLLQRRSSNSTLTGGTQRVLNRLIEELQRRGPVPDASNETLLPNTSTDTPLQNVLNAQRAAAKENNFKTPPRPFRTERTHALYSPYGRHITASPRTFSRQPASNSVRAETPPAPTVSPSPFIFGSPGISKFLPGAPTLFSFMLSMPPPSPPSTPPRSSSPSSLFPCLLSPLRLGGEALSPTTTLVGSPEKTHTNSESNMWIEDVFGGGELIAAGSKRTSDEAGLSGDQRSPRRSRRIADAADARGDGDADAGEDEPNVANARRGKALKPRKPCVRGAKARPRVSTRSRQMETEASVEEIRQRIESEDEPASQPKKRGRKSAKGGKGSKKPTGGWVITAAPNATRDLGFRIVALGMIALSIGLQQKLGDLIRALPTDVIPSPTSSTNAAATSSTTSIPSTPILRLASTSQSNVTVPLTPFAALLNQCHQLENNAVLNDLYLMMRYIEVAFYIQWRQTHFPGSKAPSLAVLALEAGNKSIDADKLSHWSTAGTRLTYLVAATGGHILLLIAVAGLRFKMCKGDTVELIEQLGYILCSPHPLTEDHRLSRECGEVIRTLIAPQMIWLMQVTTQVNDTLCLHFPPDATGNVETIPFSNIKQMRAKLRSFDWSYFNLPDVDSCWDGLEDPLLAPVIPFLTEDLVLTEECIGEVIDIRSPLDLKSNPTTCPVTPANTEAWTAVEREKAAAAYVVKDVADLKKNIALLHAGGVKQKDQYICIPAEIMEGKVLSVKGPNDQLQVLVITNILETLPHLQASAKTVVSTVMEGEVFMVNSALPGHEFVAVHADLYNRYSEQGHSAPKNVHPNLLKKEGVKRRNVTQRAPHTSQEMNNNPVEVELLAELIQLITVLVEVHLKKLLPEHYERLRVSVSRLPLNQWSHAHPFSGFVINIGVSTRGHRDPGDQEICVVIPFGEWEGGELGLYELGFLFRLRAWDAIIFPSCDVTHFNQHFEGERLSLVLHTDKHHDRWIVDHNGWKERKAPETPCTCSVCTRQ